MILLWLLLGCVAHTASLSVTVLQPPPRASVRLECLERGVERTLALDEGGRSSAEGLASGLCFLTVQDDALELPVGFGTVEVERGQHRDVQMGALDPELYAGARATNPDFVFGILLALLPLDMLEPLDPGSDGESYRLVLLEDSTCFGSRDRVFEFHRRGEVAWGVLGVRDGRREVTLDAEAVRSLGERLDALGLHSLPPAVEARGHVCFGCVPVLLEVARAGQAPLAISGSVDDSLPAPWLAVLGLLLEEGDALYDAPPR